MNEEVFDEPRVAQHAGEVQRRHAGVTTDVDTSTVSEEDVEHRVFVQAIRQS